MATITKYQQRLRANFAEAKAKIKAAMIHDMYLLFDKKRRLTKIVVGERTFMPFNYCGKVMIMDCGREFAEYTVEEFIDKHSFN